MPKYRDYTIKRSGENYVVYKPNGERLSSIAATLETAKKWVRWDIWEAQASERRRQKMREGTP